MKTCKYKKRLQIYLDGWMDGSEAERFEKHLKKCPSCQAELMELEDISSAALEIVDEAPERGYWDSFFTRTLNRITSRDITPYEAPAESRKGLALKIGSYSLAVVSMAAIILLAAVYLPDMLNRSSERNSNQETIIEPVEPLSIAATTAQNPSVTPPAVAETESTTPEEGIKSLHSDPTNTDFVRTDDREEEGSDDVPAGDGEVLAYFNNNLVAEPPALVLSDLPDISKEPSKTEFDEINEDYRLSSSMIASGILSEFENRRNNVGSLNGNLEILVAGDVFNDDINGGSGNWGYLSMPPDSGDSEEFRRYLIELELIQTK
jgi:hypothetical protein